MQRNQKPPVNKFEISTRGILGLLAVATLATLAYAIASRENFDTKKIRESLEETFI